MKNFVQFSVTGVVYVRDSKGGGAYWGQRIREGGRCN